MSANPPASKPRRVFLFASVDTVNQATEIRALAERQMGEFLADMPKNEGSLKRGPVVPDGNHGESTLAEIGITKKESARAQKLAAIPAPEFHARIEGIELLTHARLVTLTQPSARHWLASPSIVRPVRCR